MVTLGAAAVLGAAQEYQVRGLKLPSVPTRIITLGLSGDRFLVLCLSSVRANTAENK